MDRDRSRGRQTVVLALGPVVGVVASVLTNVITADWNWWVFAGLGLLTTVLAGSAVLTTQVVDGPDRSARPPALPPPNALHPPVGTRAFSGRAEEQAILTRPPAQAEGGPLAMVITGMGGVGKTELAIRTATELASRYPDGCLWVELRTYAVTPESRPNSAQVLRVLLNSLGEQPGPELAGVAELSARWRATTAIRRILLILDDVNDADQIQPLIPGGGPRRS